MYRSIFKDTNRINNKKKNRVVMLLIYVAIISLIFYTNDIFLGVLNKNQKVENGRNIKILSTGADSLYTAKATFYDYYSDSQVGTGATPKNITDGTSDTNNTFSKFNKRLYNVMNYGNKSLSPAKYPMYQGSFPWGGPKDLTWLYKRNNESHNSSTNFWIGANCDQGDAAATIGLVDSRLVKDGYGVYTLSQTNSNNGRSSLLPFFDKHFLTTTKFEGSNLSLGTVRENVDFPFRRVINGTEVYYEFYSRNDTVRFNSANKLEYKGYNDSANQVANINNKVGFYPYNSPADSGKGSLNYGHGLKIEFPFVMTKDGKFNGKDMTFEFSGDDDVWVFVDGYLVLDIGGSHQPIGGYINFAKRESVVDRVKDMRVAFSKHSIESNVPKESPYRTDFPNELIEKLKNTNEPHTLTFFYMERGMGGSNFNVKFNLPKQQWDLNLHPNGGMIKDASYSYVNSSNLYTKKYVADSTVVLPTQPAGIDREGFDFVGWYTNPGFTGNKVTKIVPGDEGNKDFYAKWVPKRYKLILHTDKATVNNTRIEEGIVNSNGDIEGVYVYGQGSTFPKANEDIFKSGSVFAGWYDNQQGNGNRITGIPAGIGGGAMKGDKEYWARWVTPEPVVVDNTTTEYVDDRFVLYIYSLNNSRILVNGSIHREYMPLLKKKRYFSFDLKVANSSTIKRKVSVWLSKTADSTDKDSRLKWEFETNSSYKTYDNSQRIYKINDKSRITFKCPDNVDDFIGNAGSRNVYLFIETESGNTGMEIVTLLKREVFPLC